mmetsp:Transcript_2699/g.4567  ORF Transcript_2699/g.4567 Transcript_2699/m.4567 type:complete len:161 (+) Transcript_2699:3219-3701(+)
MGLKSEIYRDIQLSLYVTSVYEIEECSIYEDLMKKSPLIRLFTVLVSALLSIFVVFCFIICCSYFRLEQRYHSLEQTVREQTSSVGLPQDYEFEEDRVFQEEERKTRRAQRQEAGIVRSGRREESELKIERRKQTEIEMKQLEDQAADDYDEGDLETQNF